MLESQLLFCLDKAAGSQGQVVAENHSPDL